MELQAPLSLPVDPKTAESFILEKKLGERIKRLRLKKSMGLVEMGKQTGLSASYLSQLETGRVVPTLRNLARIAVVFHKDISFFFESDAHSLFRIHRKKERVRLPQSGVESPTYYFESLGLTIPERSLDPYLAEFIPLKKNMEVRSHVHVGYEFLYILSGQLEIRHGEQRHQLETGDSVFFDASTIHSYRCAGEASTTAIIVTTHASVAHASMTHTGVADHTGTPNQSARNTNAVSTMPGAPMPTHGHAQPPIPISQKSANGNRRSAVARNPLMMQPQKTDDASASTGNASIATKSSSR